MADPVSNPTPAAEGHGLEEIMALKKAKVADIRARGINPYPSRASRVHDCAKVATMGAVLSETVTHTPEKLSIAGRLVELRDMGKSIFGRLADHTGRAQVYFKAVVVPVEGSVLALFVKEFCGFLEYLVDCGVVRLDEGGHHFGLDRKTSPLVAGQ